MNYSDVIAYANANYYNGGDSISEWTEEDFKAYIRETGFISKKKLDQMFKDRKTELANKHKEV